MACPSSSSPPAIGGPAIFIAGSNRGELFQFVDDLVHLSLQPLGESVGPLHMLDAVRAQLAKLLSGNFTDVRNDTGEGIRGDRQTESERRDSLLQQIQPTVEGGGECRRESLVLLHLQLIQVAGDRLLDELIFTSAAV